MSTGRTHVATAGLAAVGLGLAAHFPPLTSFAFATTAAGAALLPDADVDGDGGVSTVFYAFGALGRGACQAIHRVSGGHRHATHWLATAVAAGAAMALVPLLVVTLSSRLLRFFTSPAFVVHYGAHIQAVAAALPVALIGGLAFLPLLHGEGRRVGHLAATIGCGWLAAISFPAHPWLPAIAVAFGWAIHILADWVFGRVPLFGPVSRKFRGLGLRTDSRADHLVGTLSLLALLVLALAAAHGLTPLMHGLARVTGA